MRLILLRHGETLWNRESRLQGHENSTLSDKGVLQATRIKDCIRQLSPARVVTSDLGRARQTAELIGYPDAQPDEKLRELHMGEWTGLRKPDLIESDPHSYWQWRAGEYTPAGGESWQAFCMRINTALRGWVLQEDSDLLAVVHSGVIRAACQVFLNLPAERLLPVTPATITIFNFDCPEQQPKLEAYNLGAFIPDKEAAD
ncbi:histidine phosphatase family protein [Serratia oryzae]|uniref:Histidine phosphatase family protein n=1 Tax=Serratia oryzae TaxID=2034155 RepID=A0A1S8CJT3_9GAMM|nr:histidine phosphatase family protein [Serratia oryzae]OMQ23040.1 histidine phosphatase family protein [Serratia oryzae]